MVARARTGSGKTLAYLLPALHRVLAAGKGKAGWQALVLVPTRELCEQVREEAASVASACGADLAASSLAGDAPLRAACATAAQLVVATPAKLAAALREGVLTPRLLQERLQVGRLCGVGAPCLLCATSLRLHLFCTQVSAALYLPSSARPVISPLPKTHAQVQVLILDEADLLLSYGYEEDVQALAPHVPRSAQVQRAAAAAVSSRSVLPLCASRLGGKGLATVQPRSSACVPTPPLPGRVAAVHADERHQQ